MTTDAPLTAHQTQWQQALVANAGDAQAWYRLGQLASEAGQLAVAQDYLHQALALNPQFDEARLALGQLAEQAGAWPEAVGQYQQILAGNPRQAEALLRLAVIFYRVGRYPEARSLLATVLTLTPAHAEAHRYWGLLLKQQGDLAAAETSFRQAVALAPTSAAAQHNLAVAIAAQGQLVEALTHFNQALALDPNFAQAAYNRAVALKMLKDHAGAGAAFQQAIALRPEQTQWQFEAGLLLPPVVMDTADIAAHRSRLEQQLDRLSPGAINLTDWLNDSASNFEPPLELAYHGHNNRTLKEKFARLFRLEGVPPGEAVTSPSATRPHLGFLVTRGHEKGFNQFVAGLINHLSPAVGRISIICPAASWPLIQPAITRPQVEVLTIPEQVTAAAAAIKQARLDLLYYWEVGTDPLNYFLPFFRSAPVQCTSWGTPETTGLPALDYFLSSRLFEPEHAAAHYSEQLVQLNGLGVYYERPNLKALTRTRLDFGFKATEPLYLCTQNLVKFHPDFDLLLGQILRQSPRGRVLVKAKYAPLNEALRQRWQTRLPDVADRIEFIPQQSYEDYLNLIKVADALLDTVHYSGGTTSFEAIAVGTPIVTWPGEFMRGRMTYGCYRKIGVLDTVVWSAAEYVAKAVQLATDRAYQEQVRQKILAASEVLFEDLAAVHELEQGFTWAIEQALNSYRQALALAPADRQKHERGAALQRQQPSSRSAAPLEQDPAVRPASSDELMALGLAKYQQSEFAAAEPYFRAVVSQSSEHGEAYRYLGLSLKRRGEINAAVAAFEQAVTVQPHNAQAYSNLGVTLGELGRLAEAAKAFQRAVELEPEFAQAYFNLGLARHRLGLTAKALASLQQAAALQPDNPVYRYNLGAIYIAMGQEEALTEEALHEAAEHFRATLRLEPAHAEAHYGLGVVLQQLEAFAEATAAYEQAIKLNPDYAEAYYGLGCLTANLNQRDGGDGRLDRSIFYLRRATEIAPDYAEAHYNLGLALRQSQNLAEASRSYETAIRLAPDRKVWQLEKETMLPTLYQSEAELGRWRQQIETALANYASHSFSLSAMLRNTQVAGNSFSPPFQLVYQGYNDRAFKQRYAQLFAVDEPDRGLPASSSRPLENRYHLGFLVTRHHESGLNRFMTGILSHLDKSEFKVSVVCHPKSEASIRPFLGPAKVDFIHFASTMADTISKIKQANLDLLYYWEAGTDQTNYFLPFFRPAPIQCTSWGTPATTGLPDMDYFLSSTLFEPDHAAEHYTEQVVRLQTLGMYYLRPDVARLTKTRAELGLSETDHLYLCTQNLPKFHPEFDWLLAEILRHDGRGRILLKAKQPHLNEWLQARWQTRLPDVVDRIEFVPHQSYEDYLNLMKVVDVLLDTVHYSGGTTSYEGIAMGTPIVTLPGEFMRGRMTYGCYQRIEVMDTVATSPEEYVAKAVQLATDRAYQSHVRAKILKANAGLYEDLTAVRELERFFKEAIDQRRKAG